jgi:hypothetical protein
MRPAYYQGPLVRFPHLHHHGVQGRGQPEST